MKTCNKEGCTNPQFGGGYCKYHQGLRDDKKPPRTTITTNSIHTKKRYAKVKPRSSEGELEMFKAIWKKRPQVSEVSNTKLIFDTHSFHHILTKGAFPEARLDEENIALLTRREHRLVHDMTFDDLIAIDPRWIPLRDKYERLRRFYNHGYRKE